MAVRSGLLILLGLHLRPAGCALDQHGGHSARLVKLARPDGYMPAGPALRRSPVPAPDSGRVLRVCNAYAFGSAVDVFRGEAPKPAQKLTRKTGPLPYGQCFDLPNAYLDFGTKLEFMVGGDQHLGTFAVTDLPEGGMLQLIIARHDEVTTAAKFSSHVFEDSEEPQVAVADEYIGPSRAKLRISRIEELRGQSEEEPVKYNRVVTLEPGKYRWRLLDTLIGQDGKEAAAPVDLDAEKGGRYTLMRLGIEAHLGPSFDEDMVIFPGGQVADSHNGLRGPSCVALLAVTCSLQYLY